MKIKNYQMNLKNGNFLNCMAGVKVISHIFELTIYYCFSLNYSYLLKFVSILIHINSFGLYEIIDNLSIAYANYQFAKYFLISIKFKIYVSFFGFYEL